MTTMALPRPATSGDDRMFGEPHLLAMPVGKPDEDALERDRARRAIQRLTGQDANELLDMLGLTEQIAADPAKVCSTCQERQPISEYYPRPSARDGLCSQCRSCHSATKRRSAARRREAATA